MTGTNTGEGDGLQAAKPVEILALTFVYFEGEKIVFEDVYMDTSTWMQQLRFMLVPPAME